MEIAGWILVGAPLVLALYAYAAYPIILRFLPKTNWIEALPDQAPMVSIVIPAYNEEAQIRGAIEALVSQDYPAERLQILIVSDASTDGTDEIVRSYERRGVELLRMPQRGGKTAAENASCRLLRGEIVVNSDSSTRLHHSAVRRLIEVMADSSVGVASTCDVSVGRDADYANVTEAGYVGYEMRVRALETQTGGIVGASGSGYAIRAHLHRLPVRADLSRDFSAALTARRHGFAAVSVDDALCYIPRTSSLKAEYKRKVRTIARGLETLVHNRELMNPIRTGAFAWKLFSHKICRWLVPPVGLLGIVGLALLAATNLWAILALLGAIGVGAIALVGVRWPSDRPMPRLLSLVTFGVAANVAVVHAILRVVRGHEDHLWEPTRRTPSSIPR